MMKNQNNPLIGLFWIYDRNIYFKTQPLEEINAINNFKDSNLSHYEVWEEIKYQHPKFYLYEYEDIPRGRVVYDTDNKKIIVYCNEDILENMYAKCIIKKSFQLNKNNTIFKEDEHYAKLFTSR